MMKTWFIQNRLGRKKTKAGPQEAQHFVLLLLGEGSSAVPHLPSIGSPRLRGPGFEGWGRIGSDRAGGHLREQ